MNYINKNKKSKIKSTLFSTPPEFVDKADLDIFTFKGDNSKNYPSKNRKGKEEQYISQSSIQTRSSSLIEDNNIILPQVENECVDGKIKDKIEFAKSYQTISRNIKPNILLSRI